MAWIELSFEAMNEAVDWVYTLLAGANYTGDIQIQGLDESSRDRSTHPDRGPSEFAFAVHLYLSDASRFDVEQMHNLFSSLYRTGMITAPEETVVMEKPAASELSNSPITQIGNRFVVLPLAASYEPESDSEILIRLEPTLAFGSGFHPATRLSLQLLERYVIPSMNVLDLGSGSGILTVAAAKLGAQVIALDNDRIAAASTQRTVDLNGVASQVTVLEGSLGQGSELGHWMGGVVADTASRLAARDRFDLIVANIFARVHIALATDFQQALRCSEQGGWLIAAGFTADYEPEITAAFAQEGFAVVACERLDEWVAIVFRRTAQ
jgi:ribosomal protein L11 methyltransferase